MIPAQKLTSFNVNIINYYIKHRSQKQRPLTVQEDDQQTENYQLNIGDCRERPSLSISLFPSELNWINKAATSFN